MLSGPSPNTGNGRLPMRTLVLCRGACLEDVISRKVLLLPRLKELQNQHTHQRILASARGPCICSCLLPSLTVKLQQTHWKGPREWTPSATRTQTSLLNHGTAWDTELITRNLFSAVMLASAWVIRNPGIYACNMPLNVMPRELPDYTFATFHGNLVFLEKKLVMTNDELLFPSWKVKGTEL